MARQKVFAIEQQCAYLDVDGFDEQAFHLAAWSSVQPEPLAYARLLDPGTKYARDASIGRVITTPVARGRGLGRELMRRAIEQAEVGLAAAARSASRRRRGSRRSTAASVSSQSACRISRTASITPRCSVLAGMPSLPAAPSRRIRVAAGSGPNPGAAKKYNRRPCAEYADVLSRNTSTSSSSAAATPAPRRRSPPRAWAHRRCC